MSKQGNQVCVTGASGYIASWLVKQLLLRGYIVNATVRDPSDEAKVRHLLALEGAKERLLLFKAELTDKGSFDAPINGCQGVFHTASPCFMESQDPQVELLDPAIQGTLNVLNSCAKYPTVKRVVLTSSMTTLVWSEKAMKISNDDVINESWFSDPEYCLREKKWYTLSKTLAEEAAWKFAIDKGMDLVCMNPGYVIGPLLQPNLNESCRIFRDLIEAKAYSNIGYPTINVKDVAKAHILAFETSCASGRYCLVESVTYAKDILKMFRDMYPNYDLHIPHEFESGDNPSRRTYKVSNKKVTSLGVDFIPFKNSFKEMIDNMTEKNLISF